MRSCTKICWMVCILLSSCDIFNFSDDDDLKRLIERNKEKITISTGFSGTLIMKEGNCMPGMPRPGCKAFPVSRTIFIYEYTTKKSVVGIGPFYDTINSALVGHCIADNEGFFQISLHPGKYSIFIEENDKYYADISDGQGGINPVTVKSDSVSVIKLILDYAGY